MNTNFHAFVFISTFVCYIILRSYKKHIESTHNLFMYVLFVPIILYGGYYFTQQQTTQSIPPQPSPITLPISPNTTIDSELLTAPYPLSSSNTLSDTL